MKRHLFVFIPLLFFKFAALAQTDREFWFAAPDIDQANYPVYGPYDRPIYLRITSFTVPANVTVTIPANPSFTPINISVAANSTATIDLSAWIDLIENSVPNVISNKGIYIQSTADITVYYEVNSITCQCNPELFALKGKNAIGNIFYVPSQITWSIDTIRFPNARAAFDIVATENNTSVTITPSKPLTGRTASTPFTINLNKGQTFSSQALYRNGANLLNGSTVVSDKPVAVTSKEDLLFSDGPCADLAGDQLVPTNILGTEYGVIRGDLSTRDKVAITAVQNGTNIYLDGNATPAATINAGQSYEADITSQPALYIKTNNPVYVLHYTGNGCEVGSAIIPKLNCTGSKSVSIVRSNSGNAVVLLITKNGNQGNFLVNGTAGVINASDFSPLPGTAGNYVFCKKYLTGIMALNAATTFSLTNGKFQLGFINGDPGGYMYGYFSDFKKSNVTTTQTETCRLAPVQLNAFGGVTYQWFPATGLSNPNISNPIASPTSTTDYKVIITDEDGCVDSAFVKVIVNNCSTSDTIINDYTPILGLDACTNRLIVEDAAAFKTGDTVLMIQMKGAIIDSSNTAAFGSVTNYRNAGNYEFNYVKSVTGNTVELLNTIIRKYDIPDGKVQLIRVPYFTNYQVNNTLTCLPWDGSKGGVLVFNVQNTLTLNADIDVSGRGFRGGNDPFSTPSSFNCYENQFYYPSNPDLASEKGEGISGISSQKSFGKGPLANGGGGGNSHNSGGGGGSNAGIGGLGGYNFEGAPCNSNTPFANNGIGGNSLAYSNAENRIFMGGGGGAGHSNNPEAFEARGGSGAGIIVITSNNLQSNNYKILANGIKGLGCGNAGSGCHEGMGGGGAGGAALLNINNYIDVLNTEVKGGKGADMTASGFLKVGPGGGAGAGVVWIKQPAMHANINAITDGGINGVCTGYANNPWGATAGQSGQNLFNLSLPIANQFFEKNMKSIILKDSLIGCSYFSFKAIIDINSSPILQYDWYFGDHFNALSAIKDSVTHFYSTSKISTYTIKLVVTDANGCKDSVSKIVTTGCPGKIVNNYTEINDLNICESKLNVINPSDFKQGDTVLIIQMKGAVIDTSNTSSFGTITDYRSAGKYEFNYIKSIMGNDVTLLNTITNKFDIPDGKVQLIRVPYYDNLTIDETYTCLPWDGSKGGVFVINVGNKLDMNETINVTGKGFRGGASFNGSINNTCDNNDFFYQSNSPFGAPKGEGIATVSGNLLNGKGALANGGGGGNQLNAGGGGGGNGGDGGYGGNQSEVCNNNTIDNRGYGGKGLNIISSAENRIFMGGGGGAAYASYSNMNKDGGNGGGIVIISAKEMNITTSNPLIASSIVNANGDGISCIAGDCFDDNFSGGGAGGSILLNAANYSTAANGVFIVAAFGGRGGSRHDTTGGILTKQGPGGGGGGGLVWYNTPTTFPSPNVFIWGISATNSPGFNSSSQIDFFGATYGKDGPNLFNLKLVTDTILFQKNIDSVRISNNASGCSSFNFNGLAFTKRDGITSWQWNFGDGSTANTQNTTHGYTNTGSYNVTLIATDANGCVDSTIVPVNTSILSVNAGIDTAVCAGQPLTLNGTSTGGNQFAWSPKQYLNDSTLLNPAATVNSDTWFYLTAKNALGCSQTDSVFIQVRQVPVFSISPGASLCLNNNIKLSASGGDIYTWQPAAGLSDPNSPTPTASPTTTTVYTVNISESVCNYSDQLTTTITVNPLPTVTANRSNDIDCSNDRSQLSVSGAINYLWSPDTTLNNPAVSNPIAKPKQTTEYFVIGKDINGCADTSSTIVKVELINKGGYLMPNAFTPNGDGLNDCYGVRLWGVIENIEFSIYNRWGERIFHTNNPDKCWDGTYKGKPQDGNVFIYMINANTSCEKNVFRKGTFVLIR